MSSKDNGQRWRRIVQPLVTGAAMLAVMVVLLMWLAGAFHGKVDAGAVDARRRPVPAGAITAEVRRTRVPRIESAVGSIRAVHETSVASKVLAKVLEMKVAAGQAVAAGEVLVRLDDADVQARLEQSQAVLAAARAQRDHAQVELGRIEALHAQRAAADIEVERTRTLVKAAEAELNRAAQAVTEAETILAYTVIRTPMAGTVIDKRVEVGDTVRPGDVLLTLYDPNRMQLVASVRESLARRLAVDQVIGVRIDAIDKTCDGRISEIVPEAQASSRTFLVKVTGPCPPNVYTGMFGRLLIPLEEEELLVVPAAAARRVGQLEMVDVVDGDFLWRRAVQLGISVGDDRQVLAGLREAERVLIPGP